MTELNRFPTVNPNGTSDPRKIAAALNGAVKGKLNNLLDVTLTASAATTTLDDIRLGVASHLDFMALTAHAAAVQASIYVTGQGTGVAVVNHTSNANVDKSFRVAITG